MKKNKILLLASLMLGTALLANGTNTLKVKAIEGDTYSLVTDASTLKVGDTIILANIDAKVALSTTQNKNNRGFVEISLNENKVASYVSGLQEITLEKGTKDNTWAFNVGDGYLYAASSKNNNLKTEKTLSDNSTWTISISNNNATIKAQGTNTKNLLKYNSNNKLFSCYASGQNDVNIFVKNIAQNKHTLTLKTNSDETTGWSFSLEEGTEFDLSDYIPTKENYIFDGWYDDSDIKYTKITIGTSDVVLNAKWLEDTRTKYSISFKTNDGTDTTFETKIVIENESVVLPETNPARDGYKFTGWYTNSEATEKFDETTKITSDLILYAGWEETSNVTDVLTSGNFTATSTKYKEFDNVKLNNAVYAGFSAKNTSYNNAIQLNDTEGMGIVSTTSGGKIRKITLAWNVNTSNGKSLNIYGSNEKYTSASDLYNSSKRGTIVGTLSKGETTLEITDNYKYVGVRSSGGALYLDSITFEWEPIKPTVDETILQSSYLFTKMTNGENISNGIRFVGSVKEDKFANLSNVGFNFTLTSTDKNVTKDYAIETTKLYNKIDDSNKLVFENKEDETFTLDGYLSYSLILNNISETFTATITFYSYAIIDGVTYNSETTTINIVNGAKA